MSCVSAVVEHVAVTYCPEGTVVVQGLHVPADPIVLYVPALAPERNCPDGQDGNEVNCVSVVVEHVADTYFPVGTVLVHVVHVPGVPSVVADPGFPDVRNSPGRHAVIWSN